jgi:hypothetical protein
MDGPLADFERAMANLRGGQYIKEEDPPEMFVKGFFRSLPVTPGA